MISTDGLRRLFPTTPAATLAQFTKPLADAAIYGLTTPTRMAAFLGVTGHETGGLTRLSENLNYGADALLADFPKHFTPAEAAAYARQPERIANRVYANRMGNGPESSGDGWRYRGAGLVQLTGHDNFVDLASHSGLTVQQTADAMRVPIMAVMGSAFWWQHAGLNELADQGQFKHICVIANRGPTPNWAAVPDSNPLLALADRTHIKDRAFAILTGTA